MQVKKYLHFLKKSVDLDFTTFLERCRSFAPFMQRVSASTMFDSYAF